MFSLQKDCKLGGMERTQEERTEEDIHRKDAKGAKERLEKHVLHNDAFYGGGNFLLPLGHMEGVATKINQNI